MRSASACAGSLCARACYVRAHACAPVRRTRAPMRYQWGSALGIVWKDFDKKEEEKLSRGWMVSTTRSNPSRSVHVITQKKFTVFFPLFLGLYFFFFFLLLSLLSACFNGRKWKREVFYCPRSLYENKAWISSLFPCFGNMSPAGQKVRRLLYTLARFPRVFHPIQLID